MSTPRATPPPIPRPKTQREETQPLPVKSRAQNDIENEIRKLKLELHSLTMKSPLYGGVYRKLFDLEKLYKVMYNQPAPEITPWTKSSLTL